MNKKAMIDVAHDLIVSRNEPVSFTEIWHAIIKEIPEITEQRMARFYTNLSLDGRFVALGGNMWDLRIKYTHKELHEDARGVFRDVEPEEEAELDPFEEDEDEEKDDDEEVDEDEEKNIDDEDK
jgi:DNA-directed RNA polymerase subunit delta